MARKRFSQKELISYINQNFISGIIWNFSGATKVRVLIHSKI
jgi:hypothetical protein